MSLTADFTTGLLHGFTHSRGSSEASVVDFEGVIKTIPADERAVQGARVVTNLIPDPTNASLWSGLGTTPPTVSAGSTYLGETATHGILFDDTMTSLGYSGCRATTIGVSGQYTTIAGRTYNTTVRVALSRNLVSAETLRVFLAATPDSPPFIINASEDLSEWTTINPGPVTPTANKTSRIIIYLNSAITGGPVTVYVRQAMSEDVTGHIDTQNPSSFVDGTAYYAYRNGNTVASNVVTEAQGTAITGIEGILLEDARTNQLPYNTDINSNWTHSNLTVVDNSDRVGDLGLALVTHDTAASFTNVTRAQGTADGGPVTHSIYVKEGTTPSFSVGIYDSTAAAYIALIHFVWTAGAVVHSSTISGTYEIDDLTGGLFRVTAKVASTTSTNALRAYFFPTRSFDTSSIGNDIYFNAGNLELSGFPSSYIPTSGSIVVRAETDFQRALSIPANNFTVTMVCTVQFDHDDVKGASDPQILLLDDGTADNVFDVTVDATNDQIHLNKTVSAGTTVTSSTTATDLNYSKGDELTIVITSDVDGIHLTVDALPVVTVATGDATLDWSTLLDRIEIMPAFIAVSSLTVASGSLDGGMVSSNVTTLISSIVSSII